MYGRLHDTQAEADNCNLSPENKHFSQFPYHRGRAEKKPRAKATAVPQEDSEDGIQLATPASPSTPQMSGTRSTTPSTPTQAPRPRSYPTPFSQDTQEASSHTVASNQRCTLGPAFDMAPPPPTTLNELLGRSRRNIAMAQGQDQVNGTPNGVPNPDTDDGVDSPLQSYSRSTHSDHGKTSASTSIQVPDTPLFEQGISSGHPRIRNSGRAKPDRALEALGTARNDLREAFDIARASDHMADDGTAESIDDNTGLINRLLLRNRIGTNTIRAKDKEIQQLNSDREAFRIAAENARAETESAHVETMAAQKWRKDGWYAAALMLALWVVYILFCRWNSVEFTYIQKRLREKYGMKYKDC